jgi:hypothetical protein
LAPFYREIQELENQTTITALEIDLELTEIDLAANPNSLRLKAQKEDQIKQIQQKLNPQPERKLSFIENYEANQAKITEAAQLLYNEKLPENISFLKNQISSLTPPEQNRLYYLKIKNQEAKINHFTEIANNTKDPAIKQIFLNKAANESKKMPAARDLDFVPVPKYFAIPGLSRQVSEADYLKYYSPIINK